MAAELQRHRFRVEEYHRTGEARVFSEDDRVELIEVAVLRRRADFYAAGHPGPEDVLLVVEVAETSPNAVAALELAADDTWVAPDLLRSFTDTSGRAP